MGEKAAISNRAFWDVDFESLDFEENKAFIISKVFDRGSWDDMKKVTDFYGEPEVINYLKKARYLRDDTIRLCSVIFKIQPTDFACYIRKQQMPIPGGVKRFDENLRTFGFLFVRGYGYRSFVWSQAFG